MPVPTIDGPVIPHDGKRQHRDWQAMRSVRSWCSSIALICTIPACSYDRLSLPELQQSNEPLIGISDHIDKLLEELERKTGGNLHHQPPKLPEGWSTYSLFLVCDPEWIMKIEDGPDALDPLYRQYKAFGKAIGPGNLAVWFWQLAAGQPEDHEGKLTDATLRYDADSAIGYCTRYKLKPSRSPYVLVTTSYPDPEDGSLPQNHVLAELGDLSEESTLDLLSSLADQIVLEKLDQERIDSARYWISWKSVIHETLASLGSLSERVRISIDAKFMKIEYGRPDGREAKTTSVPD
jgi:hypothetical protein